MKYVEEYRSPDLCRALAGRIEQVSKMDMRIMEVCGTHTVSIFRHGIYSLIPKSLSLVSGPGCPVCVTDQAEIDAFIELARKQDVIITTFGDLIRVPGTDSSLRGEQAAGRDIRVVYSTMDALDTARANPEKQVVFLGVGFETTAPTVAASVLTARQEGLENYSVYCAHKLVPPALDALVKERAVRIDGFLLPGHVSVIIGRKGYKDFFDRCRVPAVIGGFEPVDILTAVLRLAEMIAVGSSSLENAYTRAVAENGNPGARRTMETVFEPCDALWRGLGMIAKSGLAFREGFSDYDALKRFNVCVTEAVPPTGCACGDILTGRLTPPECPLFGCACTPLAPVGPCMVSSEGTCAAYYKFGDMQIRKRKIG